MGRDLGLLLLRVGFGTLMMTAHGWAKISNFNSLSSQFRDPIGLGPGFSLTGAVGAEFFCALLVVLGLFTRIAALPLIFTMFVAFFVVHAADPFQRKELALLYMLAFGAVALLGPGRFSLDALWRKRKKT